MRFVSVALSITVAVTPAALCAQQPAGIDPVSVSPDKYKVVLDNETVRVVEYSVKPGEKDNPHTHPARVSYVLSGGSLKVNLGSSSFISEDTAGKAAWMNAMPRHFVENVGPSPVRIVLFEVKRVELPRAGFSKDPARVNPTSISVKLENDSVRVMEASLPPGFQEKLHSHPPYVMYVLAGGKVRIHQEDGRSRESELKAGDVFFSEPATHWAENIGGTPIRILLVEIRRR